MKDTPLHELSVGINANPRSDVKAALRVVENTNGKLKNEGLLQENSTTQDEIGQNTFDKLTKIEEIIALSKESKFLKRAVLDKTAEVTVIKNQLKQEISAKNEDVIGG